MRPIGGPFLHLDQAAEAGSLNALADDGLAAEDLAKEKGVRRGPHGDGADGVEAASGGDKAAVEGVDVDYVEEDGRGVRIELASRRRRDAVPRALVDVHLLVRADPPNARGSGRGEGAARRPFYKKRRERLIHIVK